MRPSSFAALLLAFALTSCRGTAPPAASVGVGTHAGRVVLLSIDGLAGTAHRDAVHRGVYRDPDGLSAFEGAGFAVDRVRPVNPSLTSVNHVSIATGAPPSGTGIVSNVFRLPGAGFGATVSGFDAPIGAETLWQSFRRQGKRAGVITFPGCDGRAPERTAAFGLVYVNTPFARSAIVRLGSADFSPASGDPTSESEAPPRSATIEVGLRAGEATTPGVFVLTALDTVEDGLKSYDTLIADQDTDPFNGTFGRARVDEWFPLWVRAPHPDGGMRTIGAWCLLQSLSPDLAEVRFYRGAFNTVEAYPREFRERIESEASFWPGAPDDVHLQRGVKGEGGIGIRDYLAQAARFSRFFTAAAIAAVRGERFDLLLAYQPVVDEVGHAFTLRDPRQTAWSQANQAVAAGATDEVLRIADRGVGELARSLDLSRDALVVVSDHGMVPVWEAIHVNEALRRAGLAETEDGPRGPRLAPTSRAFAVCSGGVAHVYVNLAPIGPVPDGERDEVVRQAARVLALLEADGEAVVEAMARRDEAAKWGLDHPNSGDLVVFLKPGYVPTGRVGGRVHEPTDLVGQHGFLSHHRDLGALWLARGAGVPRSRLSEAVLTDVAAFVSRLAGVEPPAGAIR
ncbi:MAG: alkaline phosphatase family protein [Acidobacteriota bacterium]